jgi:hypothetical protein
MLLPRRGVSMLLSPSLPYHTRVPEQVALGRVSCDLTAPLGCKVQVDRWTGGTQHQSRTGDEDERAHGVK